MIRPDAPCALRHVRDLGRAALVGYLPAGYPTVDGSVELLAAMIDGGCDLVEVGLPFSDPVLDGPVIQHAAQTALAAGFRIRDVVRRRRRRSPQRAAGRW